MKLGNQNEGEYGTEQNEAETETQETQDKNDIDLTEFKKTKKRRGPKPIISWPHMLKVVKDYPIFDDDGKLKPERKHIKMWTEIRKKLGNNIKIHNLQNYLYKRRDELKADLEKEKQSSVMTEVQKKIENADEAKNRLVVVSPINMMNVLLRMQNDVLYQPVIRMFYPYPFSLYYWPSQATELTQIVPYAMVCIFGCNKTDLIRDFCIPNEYTSNKIASYCFGCELEGEFIPLLQMISEDNDYTNLKRFFNEALRVDLIAPAKIIIEYSSNAYKAIVECFNVNFTVPKYVSRCFSYLTSDRESKIQLPDCQIFAEVDGIIAAVNSWTFSQNIESDLKLFVGNVFLLLSNSETLVDFQNKLLKLLVLTLCKHESDLTNQYYNELLLEIKLLARQADTYDDCDHMKDLLTDRPQISSAECPEVYKFLLGMMNEAKLISHHFLAVSQEISLLKQQVQNFDFNNLKNFLSADSIKILQNYPEIDRILSNVIKHAEPIENDTKNIDLILNAFYSESIAHEILNTCMDFVTWTKVMNEHFNLKDDKSTTSMLKKYYHEFASCFGRDEFPMQIDKYLVHNIDYTEKKIDFGLSKFQHKITKKKVSKHSFQKEHENWFNIVQISSEDSDSTSNSESVDLECEREDLPLTYEDYSNETPNHTRVGKVTQKKGSKKMGKVTGPYPEFSLRLQQPKKRGPKRSIIKNANSNSLKDVKIDKKFVIFLTTSPFDSISEILVSSYYLVAKFQKYLDNAVALNDTMQAIKLYASNLQLRSFYPKRAKILSNIFITMKNNKLYWDATEGEFINKIISASVKHIISCSICNVESIENISCVRIPSKSIVTALDIVDSITLNEPRYCARCGEQADVRSCVENYIFCDVECIGEKEITHNLYDLPEQLKIGSKTFVLTGAIAYEHGLIERDLRHYIACCRNFQNKWTKYDDRLSKKEPIKQGDAIMNLAIVVYIEYKADDLTGEKKVDENPLKINDELDVMEVTETNDCQISAKGTSNVFCKMKVSSCAIIFQFPASTISNHCEVSPTDNNTRLEHKLTDCILNFTDEEHNYCAKGSTSLFMNENEFDDKRNDIESSLTDMFQPNDELRNTDKILNNEKKDTKDSIIIIDDEMNSVDNTLNNNETKDSENSIVIVDSAVVKTSTPINEKRSLCEILQTLTFSDIANVKVSFEVCERHTDGRQLVRHGSRKLGKIIFKFKNNKHFKSKVFEIRFDNTCAFDSIWEVTTDLNLIPTSFQEDIQKHKDKNVTLEAIVAYCCNNFDMDIFQEYRAKALFIRPYSVKGPDSDLLIDCRANVVSLFKDLMDSFPSIIETRTCAAAGCNHKETREHCTVTVNAISFFMRGIAHLERMIQEEIVNTVTFCRECKNDEARTVRVDFSLKNYIAVELDTLYESINEKRFTDMINIRGKTISNVRTNLKDIPESLYLNNKKFVLRAAIEIVEGPLNHYVAYSKKGRHWIRYDDMTTDKEELQSYLPSIKIALLFYTTTNR